MNLRGDKEKVVGERPVSDWHHCYDDSWDGLIVDEAFAHPAKFSYGLITRIVKHGLARGYWRAGDVVGDPFGGIGTGGIVCAGQGMRWVGVELEPRFVELARRNFALNPWCRNGEATIIQGDSRNFASLVGECTAVVTSPPYVTAVHKGNGIDADKLTGNKAGRHSQAYAQGYGCDAIVTSPPYAESVKGEHGERESAAESRDARRTEGGSLGQSQRHGGYGGTDGQLGAMPSGSVDSVLTSRKHAIQSGYAKQNNLAGSGHCTDVPRRSVGGTDRGVDRAEPSDGKEAVETPGSADSEHAGSGVQSERAEPHVLPAILVGEKATAGNGRETNIGDSRSQPLPLERRQGAEAVSQDREEGKVRELRSAPESGNPSQGLGSLQQQPGESCGPVRQLPHEPSQESVVGGKTGGEANSEKQRTDRVESSCQAIITSPPYAQTQVIGRDQINRDNFGKGCDLTRGHKALAEKNYIGSDGQLGNTTGETYWSAVAAIYDQCRIALKPGGVLCCVMGNYVKQGKILDLCGQTWALLQHLGFEPLERIRALKSTTVEHDGLFEPIRRTKIRVSFFRRLAIQKGSPDPGGEEVLFLRNP